MLLLKHKYLLHVPTLTGFLQANLSKTLSFEATLNEDWLFITLIDTVINERGVVVEKWSTDLLTLYARCNLTKESWQENSWLVKQTRHLMNEVVGYQKLRSRTQASVVFSLWNFGPFSLLFGPLKNKPLEVADSVIMRKWKLPFVNICEYKRLIFYCDVIFTVTKL
jgi:hypothetical protein